MELAEAFASADNIAFADEDHFEPNDYFGLAKRTTEDLSDIAVGWVIDELVRQTNASAGV
jgi:hypothetical protein